MNLTIHSDVIIKAGANSSLGIQGSLRVIGEAGAPVVFTSLSDDAYGGDTNNDGSGSLPTAGDWGGISISGIASFDHAIVRYAGNIDFSGRQLTVTNSTIAYGGTGISAYSLAIVVTNSQFVGNDIGIHMNVDSKAVTPIILDNGFSDNNTAAMAIYFYFGGLPETTVINNNTSLNNAINGIRTFGNISGTAYLPFSNLPYVIDLNSTHLIVSEEATLRIAPGVVLKSTLNRGVGIGGTLFAKGEAGAPVVFTSLSDDAYGGDTNNDGSGSQPAAGDWGGISISGNASFDHAIVRYAGNIDFSGNQLTVTNSTIAYGDVGISVAKDASGLIVYHNNIFGNSYGMYNDDLDEVIYAENNWWGTSSGPEPYGTGNGINYDLCYNWFLLIEEPCNHHVDVVPWLAQPVIFD